MVGVALCGYPSRVQLIDWAGVTTNSLWVLGLATILAACSYADWYAHAHGIRLRQAFGRSSFRLTFNLGMALFTLGLLATSRVWWERAVWAILCLAFLFQVYLALQASRRGPPPPQSPCGRVPRPDG